MNPAYISAEDEAFMQEIDALLDQYETDIKRLWKRFEIWPDQDEGDNHGAAFTPAP